MTGFPFSTTYVASSAALPLPTFRTPIDRSGRDGQGVTGMVRPHRLALDLVLQRCFEDVDDLFARMDVPNRRRLGPISTRSWTTSRPGAEIVLLQIGAPQLPAPAGPSSRLAPLPWPSMVFIAASPELCPCRW
jgi:hypothetical protein